MQAREMEAVSWARARVKVASNGGDIRPTRDSVDWAEWRNSIIPLKSTQSYPLHVAGLARKEEPGGQLPSDRELPDWWCESGRVSGVPSNLANSSSATASSGPRTCSTSFTSAGTKLIEVNNTAKLQTTLGAGAYLGCSA